jgi:hypothetical protein
MIEVFFGELHRSVVAIPSYKINVLLMTICNITFHVLLLILNIFRGYVSS